MSKAKKAVKRKGELPLVHKIIIEPVLKVCVIDPRNRHPSVLPFVHKIIIDRVLKVCAADPRNRHPSVKYPTLSMDKMRRVLSIIFHIDKKLHYGVIRELEEYGVLRVDHGSVKVLLHARKPGKKKGRR